MTETATQRQGLLAGLNWWLPADKGGCDSLKANTADGSTIKRDHRPATITDVRGHEQDFTLDKHGSSFQASPITFTAFDEDKAIQAEYPKDVEEVAKRIAGATRTHAVSHIKRMTPLTGTKPPETKKCAPASMIHSDFSYAGGWSRYDGERNPGELPDDWEKLRQTRWAAISIWRPLNIVTRDALCVGDKTTIPDELLQPLKFTRISGASHEICTLNYAPGQQFHFKSLMESQDVIAIKLFDSCNNGVASCSPYTSFQADEDYGEPRNSIETRVLVFWEDQPVLGNK
ncbi:hypothetical protein LTR62_002490 [Meristemomyces frigidus]|uniref:Uncharacterized protein n=1 Tax=Meristemomyces frigidus TaxID=1508187 RepID=A0AAN7T799_9PEZI|nr:hypothetical protein LTR62_002490 [Meristemomyces frigidus]